MTGHKVLVDVHEDSMFFPSQINWFLWSRRQSNTVRTLGQASPISTRSWISVDTIWEVFARRPDATQHSRIFRVSFTNADKSDNENRPDARPSRLEVVILWEESRYSGKAVAEDRPD
jgi:hypothetical protein